MAQPHSHPTGQLWRGLPHAWHPLTPSLPHQPLLPSRASTCACPRPASKPKLLLSRTMQALLACLHGRAASSTSNQGQLCPEQHTLPDPRLNQTVLPYPTLAYAGALPG